MRRSGSKSSGPSDGRRGGGRGRRGAPPRPSGRGRPPRGDERRPPRGDERRPPRGDERRPPASAGRGGRDRPGRDPVDGGADRLEGRNVVLEALRAGRRLRWVRIDERARPNPKLDTLRELAAQQGVAVTATPRDRLDAISRTGTHNGVIAEADPLPPTPLPRLLDRLRAAGRTAWIVALVDGVEPDDVGAVLRTADAIGVDAVALPPDDGPLLSAGARRVAMGAAEHLPLARGPLLRTLQTARAAGLRTVVAAPGAHGTRHTDADLTGPLCVVLADALSRVPEPVRDACDEIVAVEGRAGDRLLPLSALAAVVLYERDRQRRA